MQCSNELFCFLLCRIWDDHPCDHSWEDFLDLLRSFGLCGHHPVLQPLSGAHHYPAGRGDEGRASAASADQRPPPARDLPGLRGEYVARLETLGVSCDAHSGFIVHRDLLLRVGHVHSDRRLDVSGLAVFLLRHVQHHWFWRFGEQPKRCVRLPRTLPVGQLLLYLDWSMLHLLALQRHLNRHQAGPQLDAGENELRVLPALQQSQRFLGTPQRHQARLAPQTRTLRPDAGLGRALW